MTHIDAHHRMYVRSEAQKWLSQSPPPPKRCLPRLAKIQTLLVDNYDSYTYNLYHLISATHGVEPTVVLNDEWTLENVQEWIETQKMPSIVISPGPGSPTFSRDTGFCPDLFQCFPKVPILGVCLGHQILGSVYGGVTKRVNPVHGRLSGIAHNSHPLFCDISSHPEDFRVVRYHSLAVDENSLPEDLIPIAWTYGGSVSLNGKCSTCNEERVLMGLAHRKRPHYGVQFHPESIGSTFGEQLLINFRNLTLQAHEHPSPFFLPRNRPENELERCPTMHLKWEKLKGMHGIDSDALFDALFESMGFQDTFWLDSAASTGCRFSFMGGPGSCLWRKLTYDLKDGGQITLQDSKGRQTTQSGSLWEFLDDFLASHSTTADSDLPFDFHGGFVGYFGYELKALCGSRAKHSSSLPDASLFFADRLIVMDHQNDDIYCLATFLKDSKSAEEASLHWIQSTITSIRHLVDHPSSKRRSFVAHASASCFKLERSRERYEADILHCLEALYSGESYELCLTNKFRKKRSKQNDREFYRILRSVNPAPYAAWLKFGSLTICCSSPERFLKDSLLDRASAEALKASEKDQAENLMIVDLLRNDLGRVCEPSTVHVPSLMKVESFARVHQLVSTVRGRRKQNVSIVNAIRAAFPAGSMTGAPKLRSIDILDRLEDAPRGVYSGSIGYLSTNATFDLNVVIRTAILTADEIIIGSGGAVVLQSHPSQEFSEMKLKAEAILEAISFWEANSIE